MAGKAVSGKIVEFLKNAIAGGELKIGDAVYSENMLCERFKVSRTSVRKAVRQMVEENLLVSRQGVGTFVKSTGHGVLHGSLCLINHYMRALRCDYADTYYMNIVYGAEEAVSRHGLNFQLFSAPVLTVDDVREKMAHIKVDGALLDCLYQDRGDSPQFKQLTPHVVVLDGNPEDTSYPVVALDAEPVYEEFLKLGLARGGGMVYLHDSFYTRHRWRLNCVRRACRKVGCHRLILVDYSEGLTENNFTNLDHGYLIYRALEKAMTPAANVRTIITDNDHAAVKALNFLRHKGVCVPVDVAISGFSGMALTTMVEPALTTVLADPRLVAQMAVDFLLEIIEGRTADKLRLVPTQLLRRASL